MQNNLWHVQELHFVGFLSIKKRFMIETRSKIFWCCGLQQATILPSFFRSTHLQNDTTEINELKVFGYK
jgi:hypothetical protein